jgi:hypothetical protein
MRIEPSYDNNWAFLMSKVGKFLSNMWSDRRLHQSITPTANIGDVSSVYEAFEPYSLGVYYDKDLQRRDRKSIYTEYKKMMQDPTIHGALNLLVSASLGGHESRGEVVFIRPADKIKNDGKRATELREMIEKEAPHLQSIINNMIFVFTRNGIGYGDSYARVYPIKKLGVVQAVCNETVDPPLIQSFEQAGRTIGFHALEISDFEIRQITKLHNHQLIRMKMPRVTPLPQFRIDHVLHKQLLNEDDPNKAPIIPSPIGGSFLQAVAPAWRDWALMFTALNSQQIADSVNNQFLSIDMSAMPEASREKYKKGLQSSLEKLQAKIKSSLDGGEALYTTNWVAMPTWGEKQVINPLGDMTQRTAPISLELALTHLKRGVGSLGLDLSLLGWMEYITGGLGEGGAFHTSAQVGQQSALIRQAVTEPIIDICLMHFSYKYGKAFDRSDLPFKIEFYSDITATATEALNNKRTRADTMAITAGAIMGLKELGLDEECNHIFLADMLGLDDVQATKISASMAKAKTADDIKLEEGDV